MCKENVYDHLAIVVADKKGSKMGDKRSMAKLLRKLSQPRQSWVLRVIKNKRFGLPQLPSKKKESEPRGFVAQQHFTKPEDKAAYLVPETGHWCKTADDKACYDPHSYGLPKHH